jgi:hypothetical protein
MQETLVVGVIHLRSFPMPEFGTTEVRTYRARSQDAAEALMAADLVAMSQRGLAPSTQVWAVPPSWRAFVTPIVLTIVGFVLFGVIGAAAGALFGIAYLLLVRQKGTLTVTFSQRRVLMPAWSTSPGPITMTFVDHGMPWSRQRR